MEDNRFEQFSSLITGIYGSIQKIKTKYAKALGLKPVHIFWIYLLSRYPEGLSASELARKSKTNRSLVSREIEALFEDDIIVSSNNRERKYGSKLILTEKGSELAKTIDHISNTIQDQVSSSISNKELQNFYKVLALLSDNFEEVNEQIIIQEILKNEYPNC